MTTVISAATRQNLAALQMIADQLGATQIRLATGRRVNGAFDNPSAFFTSSALSARAASLNQLADGITDVKKTVEAANNGAQAIKALLTTAQSLANSALQSANTLVKVTGTNSTPFTTGSVIATTGGSTTRLMAGDVVTVSDGTTTATYTAANNDTVQTFLNAVNNTANLKVTASLNASGQITLTATSTNNVIIGATLGGVGTLNGVTGLTAGTTTFAANAVRTSYAAQFDAIRTQINAAATDASYNGLNLLAGGSKTVTLNETGSSTITLSGVTITSTSLGVAASTNSFQIDSDITTALTNITNALTTLQAQTATFGNSQTIVETRMAFNKSMAQTLQAGADALVASDANQEGAMLAAMQTRQQLAAAALSMTSKSDSVALRLFGIG
jgi:flagellin-like hook-associated protein FlgL